MKTFLVIGHHKVGTTALQRNIANNLEAYRQAGVLYPIVESEGLEHLLRGMSGNISRPDAPPINAMEPHNALAFRILTEHKVMRVPRYHHQLTSANQEMRTIVAQQRAFQPEATIFVSEVMSHFGLSIPDFIPEFRQRLLEGSEVHIVLILRRPDEHIQSWYGQLIRLGQKLPALREGALNRFRNTIHFQYQRVLEPWLQHVPEATFHPVYYPEVIQSGGLVVFMNQLLRAHGLDVPTSLDDTTRRNMSYHPVLFEPLRRWVKEYGPLNPKQEAAANKKGELPGLPDRKLIEIWGQENRSRMFEEFLPQKLWFDEMFGPGTLFHDFEKTAETLPIDDADVRADPAMAKLLNLLPGTDDLEGLG